MNFTRCHQRREEDRSEFREAIAEAAYQLAETGGMDAVSMRAIADRIRYSVRTVYLYFKDKEAVLDAVRAKGFQELYKLMMDADQRRRAAGGSPRRGIYRLGEVYLSFAADHPGLFSVMYYRSPDAMLFLPPGNAPAFDTLVAAVAEAFGQENARSAALCLWGMAHGLATIGRYRQDVELSEFGVMEEYRMGFSALFGDCTGLEEEGGSR